MRRPRLGRLPLGGLGVEKERCTGPLLESKDQVRRLRAIVPEDDLDLPEPRFGRSKYAERHGFRTIAPSSVRFDARLTPIPSNVRGIGVRRVWNRIPGGD